MAKFIHLEVSKQFLNLNYVSLVTQLEGDKVAISIIDRQKEEVIEGSDCNQSLSHAHNESEREKVIAERTALACAEDACRLRSSQSARYVKGSN